MQGHALDRLAKDMRYSGRRHKLYALYVCHGQTMHSRPSTSSMSPTPSGLTRGMLASVFRVSALRLVLKMHAKNAWRSKCYLEITNGINE